MRKPHPNEHSVEVFDGYKSLGRFAITEQTLVIGSRPDVQVSLPKDSGLKPVHFSLEQKGRFCQLRIANDAKLHMAGAPVQSGPIPWDATLTHGSYRFQLSASLGSESRNAGSAPVWVGLLLSLPLLVWLYSDSDSVDISSIPKFDFNHIFEKTVECPEQGPARYRAERLLESAASKEERYMFEPHDGIEAINLYAQASACMASAGHTDDAQKAERKSLALKKKIKRDFILHQVKLERALAQQDHGQALSQARILINLIGQEKSDYLTWLQHIERQLNVLLHTQVGS